MLLSINRRFLMIPITEIETDSIYFRDKILNKNKC